MELISTKEIVDIIRYSSNAVIFVEKRPLPDPGQYKASYSVVNFETKALEVITKGAYLLKKFGPAYKTISDAIPNFVQCDAAVLYDRRVLTIYPNGEAGIFDRAGSLEWSGIFQYHEMPIRHLALEGKYFWSICPKENCVIRYACQNMKVDLRIGSKDADTFINPSHICYDSGDLYVCCAGNKVRRIDGMNYTVADYKTFGEPIRRFYKFCNFAIAVLASGTYFISEEELR